MESWMQILRSENRHNVEPLNNSPFWRLTYQSLLISNWSWTTTSLTMSTSNCTRSDFTVLTVIFCSVGTSRLLFGTELWWIGHDRGGRAAFCGSEAAEVNTLWMTKQRKEDESSRGGRWFSLALLPKPLAGFVSLWRSPASLLPFPSSVLPSCRPSVVTFAGVGWSASAVETLQLSVHCLFSILFLFDSPTAVVERLPLSVPSVVLCHRYDSILLLGI